MQVIDTGKKQKRIDNIKKYLLLDIARLVELYNNDEYLLIFKNIKTVNFSYNITYYLAINKYRSQKQIIEKEMNKKNIKGRVEKGPIGFDTTRWDYIISYIDISKAIV